MRKQNALAGGTNKRTESSARTSMRTVRPSPVQSAGPLFSEEASSLEVKTVVKPVQNAIAILRYLVDVGEPSTATQIARALHINTSTCFNILRTLTAEGVASFDPAVKTYKIGLGILKLASNVISEESRIAAAKPYLQAYASRHKATVCIWRRISVDRNMLIAIGHAHGAIRIDIQIGQRLPVLLGSTGRVMAMRLGLTKTQLRAQFRKLRWDKPPTFERFWEEAQLAHQRGWALDDGDFSTGVLTVSAPIFNSTGDISYSLTAFAFRDRHREEISVEFGEDLVRLATELRPVLY